MLSKLEKLSIYILIVLFSIVAIAQFTKAITKEDEKYILIDTYNFITEEDDQVIEK